MRNPKERKGLPFQIIVATLCIVLCADSALSSAVTTPASGWTFTEDESPVFVLCPSSFVLDGGGADSAFTVLDWRGNEVRRGEWPADGRLELAPLPSGFYRVKTGRDAPTARPQGGRFVETPLPEAVAPFDFCVVRRDPCQNPDSPFAVDSALSHRAETFDCPWYDGDTFRGVCELMRKCGVAQTRERRGIESKLGLRIGLT